MENIIDKISVHKIIEAIANTETIIGVLIVISITAIILSINTRDFVLAIVTIIIITFIFHNHNSNKNEITILKLQIDNLKEILNNKTTKDYIYVKDDTQTNTFQLRLNQLENELKIVSKS